MKIDELKSLLVDLDMALLQIMRPHGSGLVSRLNAALLDGAITIPSASKLEISQTLREDNRDWLESDVENDSDDSQSSNRQSSECDGQCRCSSSTSIDPSSTLSISKNEEAAIESTHINRELRCAFLKSLPRLPSFLQHSASTRIDVSDIEQRVMKYLHSVGINDFDFPK
jgi:hypothetical protein